MKKKVSFIVVLFLLVALTASAILLLPRDKAVPLSYIPQTNSVSTNTKYSKKAIARTLNNNEYTATLWRSGWRYNVSYNTELSLIKTKEEYDASLLSQSYDEDFFKENYLINAYIETGSGSISFEMDSLQITEDNTLLINLECHCPMVVTDDMSGWSVLIEINKNLNISDVAQLRLLIDGKDHTPKQDVVRYERYNANFALPKIDNWEYFIEEPTDENSPFGVSFKPKKENGKIMVLYYPNGFNQDVSEHTAEEITLGKRPAIQYTPKDSEVWEFIVFTETAGDYVALNNGADEWLNDVYVKRFDILKNMVISDGTNTRSNALLIVTQWEEGNYTSANATFDYKAGKWTVELYQGEKLFLTEILSKTGNTISRTRY